mmetsp:Transcript_6285/g.3529  ORF Transcript_6285/g.3529 Transcript_6285/m.3529 type:complete len:154 (-) Transcript_6285:517-978(-)
MERSIEIINKDLKTISPRMFSTPVDIVVSNPPYRKVNSGRLNPNCQKAAARHELKAKIADVIAAAKRLLRTGGKFITIYPAERITDLFYQMRLSRIEPKKLQMVHSKNGNEAKLILVEGVNGGKPGINILYPLVIYNNDGSYTKDIEKKNCYE